MVERPYGIGFDLDHTLAIDNRIERVAFLHLLERLISAGGQPLGTLAEEIDNIDGLLSASRHSECSIDEAVRRFVAAHAFEPVPAHVTWFRETAVSMVDQFVVPLPAVGQTLAALAGRAIPMAVLTNGWNPMQLRKARRAGFHASVLVSSEIGSQKPAAGAFEALLRTLGTQPDHSWYVGDDPYGDVAGARKAGMRTVWIDWEGKEYPREIAPPDHTIHCFDELLQILPGPVPVT